MMLFPNLRELTIDCLNYENNLMKERVEYIDVARGIAMLLVILGHCHQTVDCTLNRFILSFHMPLFFFLSGIFATTTTKGAKNLMGG